MSAKVWIEPSAPPPLYSCQQDVATSQDDENAPELATSLHRGRERDGVVEGETEGLVRLLRTLVVEELGHDLVPEGEEGAARCVGRGVLAIGTSNALGERS